MGRFIMRFRPCIDIHNGKVKQIVGSSLTDEADQAVDNYVSEKNADFYARLYQKNRLPGGHVILLNPASSEYYQRDLEQARLALGAYPGGLMAGGGINPDNAGVFIDAGASQVIVTSYVFRNGMIDYDNLKKMRDAVGSSRLVLDLSCRRKDGRYLIVTDRWQKFTDTALSEETLDMLAPYCSEFLVHAVDVEGKASGIEKELAVMLGSWDKIPITYAGGISSLEDVGLLRRLGQGRLDFTIGSALDLFGGKVPFCELVRLPE